MTKSDLIEKMAEAAGISRLAAGNALTSFMDGVAQTVKKGEKVTLVGFGNFTLTKRKSRNGRNPRTGQKIKLKPSRAPKFTAGREFKNFVN